MKKPITSLPLPIFKSLRVAIICDWLLDIGGAERVVLELHKMFPNAPIYTSQYDPSKLDWFADADVRTTWLQKLPKRLKKFLPVLRTWAFSHLKLDGFDLIISATGAEAKGIKTSPYTTHICYCFAPTHYYWSRYNQYMKEPGFGVFNWLARIGLRVLVGPMRRWDRRAAQRPDYMIGISTHIQKEIKRYYRRDAAIIHPPVDTDRFSHLPSALSTRQKRFGFIIAGRQTAYKRFDLAVSACTELNLPLTVIGTGPEHKKLQKLAGPSVAFLTDVSDKAMPRFFQTAEAFIFPGLDDFGIVPLEAMAAGTPVIAYKAGGALDYIIPGQTGEFFEKQTVRSMEDVLTKFNSGKYQTIDILKQARSFDSQAFRRKILTFIKTAVF